MNRCRIVIQKRSENIAKKIIFGLIAAVTDIARGSWLVIFGNNMPRDPRNRLPLELTDRERDLIMKHTFAENLMDRLRAVPSPGRRPFYRLRRSG